MNESKQHTFTKKEREGEREGKNKQREIQTIRVKVTLFWMCKNKIINVFENIILYYWKIKYVKKKNT